MAPGQAGDRLSRSWCCLACHSKFKVGEMIVEHMLLCPRCRSDYCHPIGDKPMVLEEYYGHIGVRH
jgi:Zn finger protein HypA/HybF involved in hydrogenase expression